MTVIGPDLELWTAPEDQGEGPWRVLITARGAGGGDEGGGGNQGGQGAEVIAEFVVQNGETILAIAGGPGGTGATDAGGGGGGSGAVNCGVPANCAPGTMLIVAAGGNGGEGQGPGNGGQALNGPPGAGGVGGGNNGGGGGGGMLSAGQPGDDGTGGSQVSSFGLVPGGLGSDGSNDGGEGMGGGGGGGSHPNNGSGGGAGRSGAAGGNINFSTSYIDLVLGSNPQGTDGFSGAGPSAGTVTVACLGSLPIHLINFKAVIHDESVALIWSTASEKDNHGYDVQRSADNRNWTTLGFVPGNGTTAEKSAYKFADEQPLSGVNYYRLKQMDTDGSFYHTPMVVADVRANTLQFDIFPNPSTDGALTFRTVSKQEGDALLEIWDWAGYKVWRENHHLWEGTTVWPVSMTNFPKGAYTARLQMPDGTSQFRKIVLQ